MYMLSKSLRNECVELGLEEAEERESTHTYTICTKMWQPECSLPYDTTWDFQKFALGFDCIKENWCDSYYSKAETIAAQTYLYDLQHPATCNRVLVFGGEYWWGLGADLHTKAQSMGISVGINRTAIIGRPDWTWARIDMCKEEKYGADCWFQPYSSCSPDQLPEWTNAPVWTGFNDGNNAPVLRCEIGNTVLNDGVIHRVTYVPPIFSHKDNFWWHAQTSKYLTRPNARTLALVKSEQIKIFGGDGSLPHPIISLFIRHGDKWKEAQLKTVKEHMDTVMPIADRHNIRLLYVGTDDQTALDELKRDYGSRFKIYYIDTRREPENHTATTPMEYMKNNWEIMRVSLIDLYVQIQGDVFVGTRSSNWCRLIDEVRKANGKARIPYYSPEDYNFDNKR
jgi:hypothetical protein